MTSKTVSVFLLLATIIVSVGAIIASSEKDINTELTYTEINESTSKDTQNVDVEAVKSIDTDKINVDGVDTSNLTNKGLIDNPAKDEHGCVKAEGYVWCESKKKCLRPWEEVCEDEEIIKLIEDIEKYTSIDFIGNVQSNFNWKTSLKEVELKGIKFDADKIEKENADKVDQYFIENGFKTDVYNISAELYSNTTGYFKDRMACQSTIGTSGYKYAKDDWVPKNPELKDIEIYCGIVK